MATLETVHVLRRRGEPQHHRGEYVVDRNCSGQQLPCYRCENTIRRALDSVLAQSWLSYEVKIVDDCSPDFASQFWSELTPVYGNTRIRLVQHPFNGGPGAARNSHWKLAVHPDIAFLDAEVRSSSGTARRLGTKLRMFPPLGTEEG